MAVEWFFNDSWICGPKPTWMEGLPTAACESSLYAIMGQVGLYKLNASYFLLKYFVKLLIVGTDLSRE